MNMKISNLIKPGTYSVWFNPKTTMAALAVSLCFFSGCASFSDQMTNRHKINLMQENLQELSGTYKLKPDLLYKNNGEAEMAQGKYLAKEIHGYLSQKNIDIDTSANLQLTVKILDSNHVSFLFKNDEMLLDSVTLSTELQPTGLLYLGNHYVKAIGVPYLWGGTMCEKTRIGLANDGGLILHHVSDRSGGVLLVFLGGHSFQSAYHFKRINSK